jgi:predicted CXXCH cytochrome family protein
MSRYPLLAVLAVLIVSLFVACNGHGVINPGPQVKHFVSAEVCSSCHKTVTAQWEKTRHHNALADLLVAGEPQSYCVPCHVVGLDSNPANSGYDDPNPDVAKRFGGVQCESCHGEGSDHIKMISLPGKPLGSETCAKCHDGAHHPTFTEWNTSLHAKALDPASLPYFTKDCLRCHSADYIFADSVPADAKPTDFKYGITCIVCHDPHSEDNPFQLRAKTVDLCARCHNDENATPGSEVHHPNADMFMGSGGYEYPGKTYENSAHSTLEKGCASCHMYTAPFSTTTNTAISGHTFKPVIEACQVCHEDATTFDRFGVQTQIHGLLDTLKAKLDAATDNDKLTVNYERAMFNYNFCDQEGSYGIHNFSYAVALLTDSIENFNPGS